MTTVKTEFVDTRHARAHRREVKEAKRRRQSEKRVERSALHDSKIYFEII